MHHESRVAARRIAAIHAPCLAALDGESDQGSAHRWDRLSLSDLLLLPGAHSLRADARIAAETRLPVVIVGESGTGKTELAHAIAAVRGGPVVRCMLGATDDLNTITSELFGHERGAFSGAVARRTGLVEHANGGTLVLDEILNLSRLAQQVLLDFTQFGTFRPLGYSGRDPRRSEVRIVAVTNGALERAVDEGRFRLDLYHRIAGHVIRVPSLRERRADIPSLASAMLATLEVGRGMRLGPEAARALAAPGRVWQGNLRELHSTLVRGALRATLRHPVEREILREDLFPGDDAWVAFAPATNPRSLAELDGERVRLDVEERRLLLDALHRSRGVIAQAARELGIPRTTLASRVKRLKADREPWDPAAHEDAMNGRAR